MPEWPTISWDSFSALIATDWEDRAEAYSMAREIVAFEGWWTLQWLAVRRNFPRWPIWLYRYLLLVAAVRAVRGA